ncbi:DNA fragmentation factor subunit beta isoform X2 [Lucilia sericata]|uniref:DNA fragmentation factor subunit beta isoform X2 n=1 Tax=Lucilia sericata TaxID=13632 RepID=UPI0018A85C00|nr:DNA fragmentation factor subunit beta isoform X2 [Lucilia sericata]
MFNFIKEVMAPTTRSTAAQRQQQENETKNKENFEESLVTVSGTAIIKGYKITDNERSRKYGIGANSLQMLKTKAKIKFPIKDLRIYLASDGYEVTDEDYFLTLEPQTLFIVAGPEAIITTDNDFQFEQLRQRSPLLKVADIIYEFMEQQPDKFGKLIADYEKKKLLNHCRADAAAKTHLSLRSEHAEWFMGQEEKCHTKEEALARKAQDRVRTYYYKTKDELTRNHLYRQNLKARKVIDSILEKFRYLLIGCDYFSMIFDRKYEPKHDFLREKLEKDDETDARAAVPNKKLKQVIKDYTLRNEILDEWSVSLCTDLGDFYCQGSYSDSQNNCSLQHSINPYASRENLILFQVWNLDHQIELSRTILPSIIANVRELIEHPRRVCHLHKQPVVDISVLEYFLEIFSLKNLKLVHIVCHEKVQRTNKSNGRLLCAQCHEYKIVEELMAVQVVKEGEQHEEECSNFHS